MYNGVCLIQISACMDCGNMGGSGVYVRYCSNFNYYVLTHQMHTLSLSHFVSHENENWFDGYEVNVAAACKTIYNSRNYSLYVNPQYLRISRMR